MKKSSKFVYTYNPNKAVQVTVTNSPKFVDDEFVDYDRTVTVKIKLPRSSEQLKFGDDTDIAKFIETVDFEDPQTGLSFEEDTDGEGIARSTESETGVDEISDGVGEDRNDVSETTDRGLQSDEGSESDSEDESDDLEEEEDDE